MAIAKAKAFYNFGFSQIKLENVDFLTNDVIAFPSGTCCVLLDIKKNSQHSIHSCSEANSITALSISYNKRFLAFAERVIYICTEDESLFIINNTKLI